MKKIVYYIVFTIWWSMSLLPLWVLYRISDVLYYLIYYIIRYRRRLVRKNLTISFPEKTQKEIIQTEKAFYSWFCDYIVETIKLMSMSKDEMKRRMRFDGVELLEEQAAKGKSCGVYLGHYCNWEWVSSLPLSMSPDIILGQLYHPLENKHFDNLFIFIRERMGAECIAMEKALRRLVELRRQKKTAVIGFIADQKPHWANIHYWTNLLNHPKTPMLTGTEKLIRGCNYSAFYIDMHRERRGYYVAKIKLLSETPKELADYELTEMYVKALEQSIRRDPATWLWTHDRWKRTWERYCELYDPETRKRRPEAK